MACLSQKLVLDNHVVKRVMTLPLKLYCHGAAEIRGTFHDDHQDRNLTAVIMQYRSHVHRTKFKTDHSGNLYRLSFTYTITINMKQQQSKHFSAMQSRLHGLNNIIISYRE
jgi:hypothetical protein